MCLPAQFPGFKDVTYELESKPWFKRLRLAMLRAQDLNSSTQEEEENRSLGGQPGLYSQTLLQNNNKPLSLYCILTGRRAQLVLEDLYPVIWAGLLLFCLESILLCSWAFSFLFCTSVTCLGYFIYIYLCV